MESGQDIFALITSIFNIAMMIKEEIMDLRGKEGHSRN